MTAGSVSSTAAPETWAPVAGYEGRYEVSDLGRVRSLPRKHCPAARTLAPRLNKQGYVMAMLYGDDGPRGFFVHRLVCAAFNGPAPTDRPDVNHIDGVKANNHATNLEWTNDSLNRRHAYDVLGTKSVIGNLRPWLGSFGARHPRSKAVIQILADGTTVRHDGVSAAARATSLSFKHISACCLGKRQRHGGFQWRFAEVSV